MSIQYQVIETGFFGGKLYSPNHPRRSVLVVDKPFKEKEKPSWLGDILGKETPAQKKAREKAAEALKKQVDDGRKDVANASFMGDGETTGVETL